MNKNIKKRYMKKWKKIHIKQVKKCWRTWYDNHKDKLNKARRLWRVNHLKEARELKRNYYLTHPEYSKRAIEKTRIWREQHPNYGHEKYLKDKDKQRERTLKDKYGISSDDYKKMLKAQNNCCAICKTTSQKNLHIDHNHLTNKVRKLLCFRCNHLLGNAKDNIDILKSAINYLKRNN